MTRLFFAAEGGPDWASWYMAVSPSAMDLSRSCPVTVLDQSAAAARKRYGIKFRHGAGEYDSADRTPLGGSGRGPLGRPAAPWSRGRPACQPLLNATARSWLRSLRRVVAAPGPAAAPRTWPAARPPTPARTCRRPSAKKAPRHPPGTRGRRIRPLAATRRIRPASRHRRHGRPRVSCRLRHARAHGRQDARGASFPQREPLGLGEVFSATAYEARWPWSKDGPGLNNRRRVRDFVACLRCLLHSWRRLRCTGCLLGSPILLERGRCLDGRVFSIPGPHCL